MKKNFLLALAGITIGGIGFGLVTPVTVILLEKAGTPTAITGVLTTIGLLSILIFSPLTGSLITKFNVRKILLIGLLIWAFGALGHIYWYNLYLLFPLRFIMGIGGTFIFVSTEVIINTISTEKNRGKNIGLYVVLLSIGIATGTMLIWTIQIADWFPFVVSFAIMFIVLIIQFFYFEEIVITKEEEKSAPMKVFDMPPLSLISSFIYGFFESSIIVVLPIFGLRTLFTETDISIFMTSFVIGGIVILYFIGHLSDKMDKRKLILSIALILSVFILLPVFTHNFYLLIAIFLMIGGVIPSLYTLGLNFAVDKIRKDQIPKANGFYIMMYGAGTMTGPIIGSLMLELNKDYGYWVFSSIICLIFVSYFSFIKKRTVV
ncbi:MAG: MFS transporter [Ignavibacteriaceae bacterium]|jgi:MFS family permease|nr:MFS transporter [Ignavibacteriaceae bacterium]